MQSVTALTCTLIVCNAFFFFFFLPILLPFPLSLFREAASLYVIEMELSSFLQAFGLLARGQPSFPVAFRGI